MAIENEIVKFVAEMQLDDKTTTEFQVPQWLHLICQV